ncbi:MAG: peptidase family protein [Acidimicrobiales bacterium]|nr:peptidase family protein [Acidimicrobiales bacterium]
MFPLESVLVPGMVLPLHVFEERYRALVRTCMEGDGEFGVVLIERGSEVGGGDIRSGVGTVARIVQADEMADGRWVVVAVGVRRVRVERWLDDDPFPRAELTDWPDVEPAQASSEERGMEAAYRDQRALLRRVHALAAELGRPAAPLADLAEDPLAGSYHLVALAPLGPLDRQRLLSADGPAERLVLSGAMLREAALVLEAQLAGG